MLGGWIIINIIKLIGKYIYFCKYQFYYLTYNIQKININFELIYDH